MAFIVLICNFNLIIFTPLTVPFTTRDSFWILTYVLRREKKIGQGWTFLKRGNPSSLVLLRIHIQEQPIFKIPINGGRALLIS